MCHLFVAAPWLHPEMQMGLSSTRIGSCTCAMLRHRENFLGIRNRIVFAVGGGRLAHIQGQLYGACFYKHPHWFGSCRPAATICVWHQHLHVNVMVRMPLMFVQHYPECALSVDAHAGIKSLHVYLGLSRGVLVIQETMSNVFFQRSCF